MMGYDSDGVTPKCDVCGYVSQVKDEYIINSIGYRLCSICHDKEQKGNLAYWKSEYCRRRDLIVKVKKEIKQGYIAPINLAFVLIALEQAEKEMKAAESRILVRK